MTNISLDYIFDKVKNNPKLVYKGGNRHRIKDFFKKNKFSQDIVKQLFEIEELRYILISTQKLPKEIVKQIIQIFNDSFEVTKRMFVDTLLYQEIDQEITQIIENIPIFYYYLAWKTIPKTLSQYIDVDIFLGTAYVDINNNYNYEFNLAIINTLKVFPNKLNLLIKSLVDNENHNSINLILNLSNKFYFNDELVKYMRKNLTNKQYKVIMTNLISRKNVSINMKAHFLLEKA